MRHYVVLTQYKGTSGVPRNPINYIYF